MSTGLEIVHITVDGKEIDGKTDIKNKNGVIEQPVKIKEMFINNKPIFIKFYANWCGPCQALDKPWNDLIEQLKKNNSSQNLAIVAVESESIKKNKDIDYVLKKTGLKVNGFPTIGAIINQKFMPYDGARTTAGMLGFINKEKNQGGGGARKGTRKGTKKGTKKINKGKKRTTRRKTRRG